MPRNVTVGVDGSPESRAAAEGAAREAGLLGLPLRVVHAWQPVVQAPLLGVEASRDQAEHMLREVGESLRLRHSRIQVNIEYRTGRPVEALCEAASEAELLILGSRALGGVSGFVLGSVGLSVAAHAKRPVVFVRAAPRGSWSTPPRGLVGRRGPAGAPQSVRYSHRSCGPRGPAPHRRTRRGRRARLTVRPREWTGRTIRFSRILIARCRMLPCSASSSVGPSRHLQNTTSLAAPPGPSGPGEHRSHPPGSGVVTSERGRPCRRCRRRPRRAA